MYYKPHIIQVKSIQDPRIDANGHPIFEESQWKDAGYGRCDDVSIGEMTDDNGIVYRPSYHVVIEGITEIKYGDDVRCMKGYYERGSGKVRNVKRLNRLNYSEIWL